jgi:hypothetical protein
MKDHYLLEVHGIHPSLVRKTTNVDKGTWSIEIKAPRVGTCPSCGKRSRSPKERGIDTLQGLGSRISQVKIQIPWVRFYCRNEYCRKSSFRFRVLDDLSSRGKTCWPIAEVVTHLSYEEGQNNLEISRLLWSLYGVSVSEPSLRRMLDDHQVRTPQDYAPKHLGIDEFFPKGQSNRRGRKHRARLMLLDLDLGVVIAQVRGLDKQAAYRLLQKAKKRCDLSQVESVTRDLCEHWDAVLHSELDQKDHRVSIRVDRFHLVRNLINELYTKIYAPKRMQLREEGYMHAARELFVNRYRFRKRRSRLKADDDRFGTVKVKKLDTMLDRFPDIRKLYELKEDIFDLLDLGPGDEKRFEKHFYRILQKAIRFQLHGLVDRLIRHQAAIEANILSPPTPMLPEQCFVSVRAAERRRKSFRTERSRERYYRARLKAAILLQREVV